MAAPLPNLSPGSQQGANVQVVVGVLQNLVQAVNALTTQISTQFGSNAVYVTAKLPSAPGSPARAFVSDSSVAAAGNFGAAIVGGGTNEVPVFFDGATWRIG